MNRPTRWAACAVLVLGSLVPVTASQGIACASESARAVLVVDTGEDVYSYCVELPDGSVTGLELIALASEQHGLSYRLGFGGEAVCMLAGVGPTGDDCFEDYPDFWGYWRGSSGGWSWASSGAGSTSVGDGDVEGWSWGSGNDGATHQRPPDTSFSDVCPLAPRSGGQRPPRSSGGQKRAPERTAQEPPSPGPAVATATRSGRAPTTSDATAPSAKTPRRKPPQRKENRPRPTRREEARPRVALEAPAVSPTPGGVLASRTTPEEERSVPSGGLAALALAAAFGVGGVVIARRRRGRW